LKIVIAYNQTGQRYHEQLEAYNVMNWHVRRILLAKNVVDTKNKDYILKKSRQSCKEQRICHNKINLHSCERKDIKDMKNDLIDKLAYETEHYPMVKIVTDIFQIII